MSESYSVTVRPGKADKILVDFLGYCNTHPEERFWQALRNWSRAANWLVFLDHYDETAMDTFYWEGKNE